MEKGDAALTATTYSLAIFHYKQILDLDKNHAEARKKLEKAQAQVSGITGKLVAEGRSAALGRVPLASNSALVGLAALVNHDGNVQWATELILGAGFQRSVLMNALARMVAEQIGVRDELVARQEAAAANFESWEDATVFLRDSRPLEHTTGRTPNRLLTARARDGAGRP